MGGWAWPGETRAGNENAHLRSLVTPTGLEPVFQP